MTQGRIRVASLFVLPLAIVDCSGGLSGGAHVRCAEHSRCTASPGSTFTFRLPPQHCAPAERVCYYVASLPDEQMRQPGPTDHDKVWLQRTTLRGDRDEERVTVVTAKDDAPAQRYFVEVRYAPMSTTSQKPAFRVVLAYDLAEPQHPPVAANR